MTGRGDRYVVQEKNPKMQIHHPCTPQRPGILREVVLLLLDNVGIYIPVLLLEGRQDGKGRPEGKSDNGDGGRGISIM